jgi:hypothetical protein
MKAPILTAFLTLALGCALATEATAQASYQQQIRTALRSAAGRVGLRNAREAGEPLMGAQNSGKTESRNLDLQAGVRYAVVGVCDASCTDIDLRIFGPTGTKVAEDVQQNATPTLEFTAPTTGRYRLAIEMVSCGEAPCAWGVQVLAAR